MKLKQAKSFNQRFSPATLAAGQIILAALLLISATAHCDRASQAASLTERTSAQEQIKSTQAIESKNQESSAEAQEPAAQRAGQQQQQQQRASAASLAASKQNRRARKTTNGRASSPTTTLQQANENQTSGGGQSSEPAELVVSDEVRRLLDYHNTPPLFVTTTRDYFVDVAHYPAGFKLATMQAIDSDGDRIEYSLQPAYERDASPYLSINSSSGELRLAQRQFPSPSGELEPKSQDEAASANSEQLNNSEGLQLFRRPEQLYFLNVVANDGKYNSIVELQIHVFNSSALGTGAAVQLTPENGRASSARLESLVRNKTLEFYERLHEWGAHNQQQQQQRRRPSGAHANSTTIVVPNFVNPNLVRPEPASSSAELAEERQAQLSSLQTNTDEANNARRPIKLASFEWLGQGQVAAPEHIRNKQDDDQEAQLSVQQAAAQQQQQQQQLVLSVAIVVCSLLVIALVLLLFLVPLSVKRLRKRLKSMETSMKHEQLSRKTSTSGHSSIVCSSLAGSSDNRSSVCTRSSVAAPNHHHQQLAGADSAPSLSQFTLASTSTHGAESLLRGPPFQMGHRFAIGAARPTMMSVQRQSSLDSALTNHLVDLCPSGLAQQHNLSVGTAGHQLGAPGPIVVNPVYLGQKQQHYIDNDEHHQLQHPNVFSHFKQQQQCSRRNSQQIEQYYPIDTDEFYSTINNDSGPLGNDASQLPGAPASLVGQTSDSRAYISTQCAAQAPQSQRHLPASPMIVQNEPLGKRSGSPDSISSRSSTRSLARFLSLPARHLAHQQQQQQQSEEHDEEASNQRSLLDEFDQLLGRQTASHSTRTIARADNIQREQQVRARTRPKATQSEQPKQEHQWELERFRLKFLDIIDEGQFGQVWRCKLRLSQAHVKAQPERQSSMSGSSFELANATNSANTMRSNELTVAVKTLKRFAASQQSETGELLAEIELMKLVCGHPNVVKLLHCCTRDTGPSRPVLLVMEHAELGNLQSFLKMSRLGHNYATVATPFVAHKPKAPSGEMGATADNAAMSNEYCDLVAAKQLVENKYHLTSRDLIKFIYHIAKGMEYISAKCVVHRDLASRNILVSLARICKIGDFGMARHMERASDVYERHSRNTIIPIRWMAPEVLLSNSFTTKSDVFSFGILMWEIITLGSTPYSHLKTEQIVEAVARNGLRPSRPEYCHSLVYNLMSSCWASDPKERPTFGELVARLDELLLSSNEYIELDQYPDHNYYNIPAQLAPGELV